MGKRSCPAGGTAGQTKEGKEVFSMNHNTTVQTENQHYIESFLKPGAENAVSTRTLMRLTGQSERELRQAIANERRAGALILSKRDAVGGYFLPGKNGVAELKAHIATLLAEIRATAAVIRPAQKALDELTKDV